MKAFIKYLRVYLTEAERDNIKLSVELAMAFNGNPADVREHQQNVRRQIKDLVLKTLSEVEIEIPKDENTVLQERITQLENRLCDLMSEMSRQEELITKLYGNRPPAKYHLSGQPIVK